jgi:hypothetical protein
MIAIRTPDQRLRIFISSTMKELASERAAARAAIGRLRLTPRCCSSRALGRTLLAISPLHIYDKATSSLGSRGSSTAGLHPARRFLA